MTLFPALSRSWLNGLLRPVLVGWFGLVGVALLVVVSQVLIRVPVVPSLRGVGVIGVGLLPEVGAMMFPVALFFGVVGLARSWTDGGELTALNAAGLGARRLLPILLLVGGLGGVIVGVLAHGVAPAGRAMAREAISQAGSTLRLQAGRPAWMGETMIMAGSAESEDLHTVFLAQGDVVAIAPTATLAGDGVVELAEGSAVGLGSEPWSMSFQRLVLPIRIPAPRVHSFDMEHDRLTDLISKMEDQGKSPHSERLVLLKRTTLAMGTPLLVLLALPLGAARRMAMPAAVGTVLGLWAVQRAGDHLASLWGAAPSAALPLVVLSIAVVVTWGRWSSR